MWYIKNAIHKILCAKERGVEIKKSGISLEEVTKGITLIALVITVVAN